MSCFVPSSHGLLLSVVVPVRNCGPWVGELLESVLDQGIERSEVIVVDNGSEDETVGIVRAVAERDARIVLLRSEAHNAATARNEGVAAASGEYLVFADGDDLVPPGAYAAMLGSLRSSGSDMVIGDHLKFSAAATWSPTARWFAFGAPVSGVRPTEVTGLLATRACWNRMIRRTFWDELDLRFPDLDSLEDIEPMTRALAGARRVDVVEEHVYLYRDRHDGDSISKRADAVTTVRYLDQEAACLELVRSSPELLGRLAEIVWDADGWAHLSRFVRTRPTPTDIALVRPALVELLALLPACDDVAVVDPGRRVLWDLLRADAWDAASEYARGAASDDADERLTAWTAAARVLAGPSDDAVGSEGPVVQGSLRTLVNHAVSASPASVSSLMGALRTCLVQLGPDDEPELYRAMRDAVRTGDAGLVQEVSGLRRCVPLVVGTARADTGGLSISGPRDQAVGEGPSSLTLRCGRATVSVPVSLTGTTWNARVDAETMDAGRWAVTATWPGIAVEFPVVSARMPLPPLDERFPLQPLADRRAGWRFLVDRRRPSGGALARVFSRVTRRSR